MADRKIYLSHDKTKVLEEGETVDGGLFVGLASEYDEQVAATYFGADAAKAITKHLGKSTKPAEPAAETDEDGEDADAEPRGGKSRPKADDKAVKAPPEDK
jgi:hypothetical protein